MKTLKQLIREIFNKTPESPNTSNTLQDLQDPPSLQGEGRGGAAPSLLGEGRGGANLPNPTNTQQNQNQTKNQTYETENHENPGDNHMDCPDVEATHRDAQECEPKPTVDFEQQLREVYQRGLIDGRNSKIMERYFPEEDGIPVFHGNPSPGSPLGDFFNIAREA